VSLLDGMKQEKKQDAKKKELETPQAVAAVLADDDSEDVANNLVFGSDRTKRQKNMLSFRKKNNHWRHIPYNQILLVDDREGLNITVFTHLFTIIIKGVNLRPISERIKHGSLSYVQESSKASPIKTDDGTAVYSIAFENPQLPSEN